MVKPFITATGNIPSGRPCDRRQCVGPWQGASARSSCPIDVDSRAHRRQRLFRRNPSQQKRCEACFGRPGAARKRLLEKTARVGVVHATHWVFQKPLWASFRHCPRVASHHRLLITVAFFAVRCLENAAPALRAPRSENPVSGRVRLNTRACWGEVMIARGLHYAAGAVLGALLLLGLASSGVAQPPPCRKRPTEAAEITAIAQQKGHVRVIVLFDSPVPASQLRSDAASIANAKAQVAAVQDAIVAAHFGSAASPTPRSRFRPWLSAASRSRRDLPSTYRRRSCRRSPPIRA